MRSINLAFLLDIDDYNIWRKCERQLSMRMGDSIKDYEIDTLKFFVRILLKSGCDAQDCDDFFLSFKIPQIGKEFDLLKFCEGTIFNIELKSEPIDEDKIIKQLNQNQYYLSSILSSISSYTYIFSTNTLYYYDGTELQIVSFDQLSDALKNNKAVVIDDINNLFKPSDYLISPLNTPEKFINNQYFLINQQQEIKDKVIKACTESGSQKIGITGIAGTGKTLLLYDIAKGLSAVGKCCIIHCAKICYGHILINKTYANIDIITVKDSVNLDYSNYRFILVDEAQRIYVNNINKIIEKADSKSVPLIFSYDSNQVLSKAEERNNTTEKIQSILTMKEFRLSEKIRTNMEIASFIRRAMVPTYLDSNKAGRAVDTVMSVIDRNKDKDNKEISKEIVNTLIFKGFCDLQKYPSVRILFCKTKEYAKWLIDYHCKQSYKFINYSGSNYNGINDKYLVYNNSNSSDTHHIIGQEFDNVLVVMDDNFYYDNGLRSTRHPNPDYLYPRLFFQGITRVRNKLAIIVVENEGVFNMLMSIVQPE